MGSSQLRWAIFHAWAGIGTLLIVMYSVESISSLGYLSGLAIVFLAVSLTPITEQLGDWTLNFAFGGVPLVSFKSAVKDLSWEDVAGAAIACGVIGSMGFLALSLPETASDGGVLEAVALICFFLVIANFWHSYALAWGVLVAPAFLATFLVVGVARLAYSTWLPALARALGRHSRPMLVSI